MRVPRTGCDSSASQESMRGCRVPQSRGCVLGRASRSKPHRPGTSTFYTSRSTRESRGNQFAHPRRTRKRSDRDRRSATLPRGWRPCERGTELGDADSTWSVRTLSLFRLQPCSSCWISNIREPHFFLRASVPPRPPRASGGAARSTPEMCRRLRPRDRGTQAGKTRSHFLNGVLKAAGAVERVDEEAVRGGHRQR